MTIPRDQIGNHLLHVDYGKLEESEGPQRLTQFFAGYRAHRASGSDVPIVVHFHGGLIGKAAGEEIAQRLFGECYNVCGYPLFFIWESGLGASLRQTLPRLYEESVFKVLVDKVTAFSIGKVKDANDLGSRGGVINPVDEFYVFPERERLKHGELPFSEEDATVIPPETTLTAADQRAIERSLERDREIQQAGAALLSAAGSHQGGAASDSRGSMPVRDASELPSPLLIDESVLDEVRAVSDANPDRADSTRSGIASAGVARLITGIIRAASNVIARKAKRRDHGLHATIIEEVLREFYLGAAGKAVWDTMKDNAAQAFATTGNSMRGGTLLLQHLGEAIDHGSVDRVMLVGHSTGAISICHLLASAERVLPPGFQFDIIFLAPACDFSIFRDTYDRYSYRIRSVTLFGMNDEAEQAEQLLDIPELQWLPGASRMYPGSLLYFVSGVLEDEADKPLLGMQRFFRETSIYAEDVFPDIEGIRRLENARDVRFHSVWSPTSPDAADGFRSESRRHGDFDDDPATLSSLTHLIRSL